MTKLPISSASDPSPAATELGSKDGRGGGDHDEPYTFGQRPRTLAPFPFRLEQYGRLLALRGRIADGLLGGEDLDAAGVNRLAPDPTESANSRPTLWSPCENCRAIVPGARSAAQLVTCAHCSRESARDQAAWAILLTAGVLD